MGAPQCRLSILRKGRVALSNLRVKGHYGISFLGFSDTRHEVFLNSTGRHEAFLNLTGRHYHFL